ncbi:MAG: 3-isopropylmalate dehydratase [Spirochaetota bacterium]|nr:3-isopropylmalate dehydratase [Spirochaetota bacterium]
MNDKVNGKIYVLGDDIDTDQIIPAQYLNLLPNKPEERRELGSCALIGLPDGHPPFVESGQYESEYPIIIAGKNFGCGSSREHAPIALSAAGVQAVVAQSYSRIFFRNSVNTGLLYPFEIDSRICEELKTGQQVELDLNANTLTVSDSGKVYTLNSLGDAEVIIKSGGIFEYAKKYGTE